MALVEGHGRHRVVRPLEPIGAAVKMECVGYVQVLEAGHGIGSKRSAQRMR